jgi:8-oxo-dGTP pyrophosphatase MutT (NUDIX family)
MKIVYTLEELPDNIDKSIFLAGPTSRDSSVESWRNTALKILEDKGYDGVVFVPEYKDNKTCHNKYDEQVSWEEECLNIADCIVFWIPRDLKKLPALTTNDEWGTWKHSGKVVLGCPKDADKIQYQEYYAKKLNIPFSNSLSETLQNAIDFIGDGCERHGGERFVPLYIWKTPSFQEWYKSQINAGNYLKRAELLFNFRPGNKNFVFLWILKTHIYVKEENRIKENEFVLSRPDISSVVLFHKNKENIKASKVVLIREFRSSASTKDSFIRELPGGSSNKHKDPIIVAMQEVKEETGFSISYDRFKKHSVHQLAGTLSAHKAHLYSVELTEEEIAWFEDMRYKTFGNKKDTEITYVEVVTIEDLLSLDIDWANIGQILSVIYLN